MTGNLLFICILLLAILLYATYCLMDSVNFSKYYYTLNRKQIVISNVSVNFSSASSSTVSFPFIWMVGLLNLNTPTSYCDYYKTSLSRQMFWNEYVFQNYFGLLMTILIMLVLWRQIIDLYGLFLNF